MKGRFFVDELLELFSKKINIHGEFHLDATQTKIMFNWMRSVDETLKLYETLSGDLRSLLEKAPRDDGGTPKALREAILVALCVGPLNQAENRIVSSVKDFLAQRFGAAYLTAQGSELDRLEALYKSIVGV